MIVLCCSLVMAMMAVGGQGAAAIEARQTQGGMYTVDFSPAPSLVLGMSGWVNFTTTVQGIAGNLNMILCQLGDLTEAASSANTVKVLDVQDDICIYQTAELQSKCGKHTNTINAAEPASIKVQLDGINNNNTALTASTLDNLFLCIGPSIGTNNSCNYYSSVFSLGTMDGTNIVAGPAASSISFPATMTLTSTQASPSLQVHGATTITSGSGNQPTFAASSASDGVPASTSLTTATQSPSQTASASATLGAAASRKSTSLSTGAKVGIALGALAFIFLLLLALLFFLKKKHSKRTRSQPEQVMLTRDMHTDSFSRNQMMMEKDRGINHTSTINSLQQDRDLGLDTPLETSPSSTLPIQRHSALSTYEPVLSAPYSGPVGAGVAGGTAASSVPRRKPTAATMASTVSRGLSTTSNSTGPISPGGHSLTTTNTHTGSGETHTPPEPFEAYHDVPIYGDARHVPQVFTSSDPGQRAIVGGGSTTPFLGEETEGMSAEEVARIEEEERRIDAAIAAAEASEASGRGR
ncbi:uncharacterized protein PAC_00784 [Phialocephala subalpina]|uniref:Mid2 domain-containing protein n=1 Tax=Phialocephala subalpina TaxID=576137 RepID=A0A1L7WDQ1_9HELO|nr:uncharacterized protein PAC_00784 [Phialocephala subalpina]